MNPEQWTTLSPKGLLAQVQAALEDSGSPFFQDREQLRPALPHIIPLLPQIEPPSNRYTAAHILGEIAPSSVRDILYILKDEWCTYRDCYAGEYLSLVGLPAVPALLDGLCDADPKIRNLAGRTLRAMHLDTPLSASALFRPLAQIAPASWLAERARRRPGDLALFATPDGPQPTPHPFRAAPVFDPRGGLVYFGPQSAEDSFQALLHLLNIQAEATEYAVFVDTAFDPREARYLVQLRIVRPGALNRFFGAYPDPDDLAYLHQPRTVGALLWAFIGHQQGYWGTLFADPRAPAGALGGDGEYAREELAFGLMTEVSGVYRIWSRAWLVEK